MLQQGNYVADVAYFIGEDVPKMTGICDPALPQGYSFDYINSEVIQNRMTVKDGKLVLPDGMSYRILVLPKLNTMRPGCLKKIVEMVRQGAVVLGPAPNYSPSLQDYPSGDQQIQQLAKELWGEVDGVNVKYAKIGQGMILSGMEMQEALDFIKVPADCKFDNADPALFLHRKLADGDIYFITNQSDSTITINPEFRISGRAPELWDATTGNIRDLPAYKVDGAATTVPLKLEAFESTFVLFRKKGGNPIETKVTTNFPEPDMLLELKGPWTVTFDKTKRGPANPVVFTSLQDWTVSGNDSIKYYSGSATYKTFFSLERSGLNGKLYVDLGLVKAMAKVRLNGKDVGGVWTAPWKVNISPAAKAGENVLEVEVVNTWVNRLIGDSKLPEAERKTSCPVNPFKPESPLDPSGLMGPVKIIRINEN
jgi:hypothetical protein